MKVILELGETDLRQIIIDWAKNVYKSNCSTITFSVQPICSNFDHVIDNEISAKVKMDELSAGF